MSYIASESDNFTIKFGLKKDAAEVEPGWRR